MRFLLDTHILLWFLSANKQLTNSKRELINNGDHKIFISLVSLWEIAIKLSIKKLNIDYDFSELPNILKRHEIDILNISFSHTQIVKELPLHHGDPFDRILIAQAISEELTLITEDQNFKHYDVTLA